MYKIFKHRKFPCIPCLKEMHIKLQWYSFFCFCYTTFFYSC